MTAASAGTRPSAALPNPAREVRVLRIGTLRGPNFWSSRPVTRLDLAVGAYDEIGSHAIPGLAERLVTALPGLGAHRCSVGRPGGFLERLARGTYVPHIVEHVALELQAQIGHPTGYGRARGGDWPGTYLVVFEHRHEAVGRRAATLALGLVLQAIVGDTDGVRMATGDAVDTLTRLAATPDAPALASVTCAIAGHAVAMRRRLRSRLLREAGLEGRIADVSPGRLFAQGLPYHQTALTIVTDFTADGLPPRFRDVASLTRLFSALTDGVARDGLLLVPDEAPASALLDQAQAAGIEAAVFTAEAQVTVLAGRTAARACVQGREVVVTVHDAVTDRRRVDLDDPLPVQAAAALARHALTRVAPTR